MGTELTGTKVSLEGTTIDLTTGGATLQGLTIDNPRGYSSDYALYLEKVTVAIDLCQPEKPGDRPEGSGGARIAPERRAKR